MRASWALRVLSASEREDVAELGYAGASVLFYDARGFNIVPPPFSDYVRRSA